MFNGQGRVNLSCIVVFGRSVLAVCNGQGTNGSDEGQVNNSCSGVFCRSVLGVRNVRERFLSIARQINSRVKKRDQFKLFFKSNGENDYTPITVTRFILVNNAN